MKILLVEDNSELADNVISYMKGEGVLCEYASNYAEAVDKILSYRYDLVILDIMLPDGNGLDVLREIRHQKLNPGVIIISAKNSLDDRIIGLNLGADDYITKPFHLSELNARIKAVYRRKNFDSAREVVFNEITLNPDSHEMLVNSAPVDLTHKEYELILYFLSNKNRVLTKQSIAEHLWGDEADIYESFDFVYQHIKNLRKKMTAAGSLDYIETIYGLGYKFNASKS